jgi:hypothetical protein
MNIEHVVEDHQREFSALLDRFGVSDKYEMFWRWNKTNQSIFGTVTVRHQRSGATESYYAGNSPEHPRYWLSLLEQALIAGTFGSGQHQIRPVRLAP